MPAAKSHDAALREHLLELLRGGHAHATFDAAVADLPAELRGKKPKAAEHTAWQLLEHLRIAQWDILEFSRNSKHVSPKWPAGYWPQTAAPSSPAAWNNSVRKFRADLDAMAKLVSDKKRDLFKPFPWGDGQTLLREALLVADHNSYHVGQLISLRRLLGAWH
jgi:uncharacterized damage-inducible protein DinB